MQSCREANLRMAVHSRTHVQSHLYSHSQSLTLVHTDAHAHARAYIHAHALALRATQKYPRDAEVPTRRRNTHATQKYPRDADVPKRRRSLDAPAQSRTLRRSRASSRCFFRSERGSWLDTRRETID
eukprot:5613574-Pleurochrysis_carterae.AAC.2